jgi:cholesterol transport system auxiliary component
VRNAPLVLAAAALVSLTACVTILPKSKPVRLYAFDQPLAQAPASQTPVRVRLQGLSFASAAAGDRILTVSGSEQAYIADARWVGPASVLFREALENALNSDSRTRLWTLGQAQKPDALLMVDVVAFEARYDHGLKAAPNVVVAFDAVLASGLSTRVSAEVRADDNRQAAIVEAFHQAVAKSLGDLDNWIAAARPG